MNNYAKTKQIVFVTKSRFISKLVANGSNLFVIINNWAK